MTELPFNPWAARPWYDPITGRRRTPWISVTGSGCCVRVPLNHAPDGVTTNTCRGCKYSIKPDLFDGGCIYPTSYFADYDGNGDYYDVPNSEQSIKTPVGRRRFMAKFHRLPRPTNPPDNIPDIDTDAWVDDHPEAIHPDYRRMMSRDPHTGNINHEVLRYVENVCNGIISKTFYTVKDETLPAR